MAFHRSYAVLIWDAYVVGTMRGGVTASIFAFCADQGWTSEWAGYFGCGDLGSGGASGLDFCLVRELFLGVEGILWLSSMVTPGSERFFIAETLM